ncbi:hypothetical protein [Bradyrhizobium vignae]|uniref:hypothetical protein n=1 Tax=Bradyrhizobium vignae TaxID=1549949 RepID=UPI00100B27A1|nr:hypothetical protein [Bradyrhizobium vignae]RXH06722.1 hypothetical protein EAV90_02605 [Bradyrhizobium vignae]
MPVVASAGTAAANNGEMMMSYDGILAGLNRHTEPERQENAKKCTPQLIQELTQAIAACERSPLLPDEIEELFDVIAESGSLRFEARKIKDDLPFFLRTSSAERLSELTARLWECAGLARKLADLREDLRVVLRHITEFDEELSNLAAHVEDMEAEAEIA